MVQKAATNLQVRKRNKNSRITMSLNPTGVHANPRRGSQATLVMGAKIIITMGGESVKA
jgi:hypothetical protein